MLRKHGLTLVLLGSALTIGLAGCGSSNSGGGSASAFGGDSFLSQVGTFVGTSSETDEPAVIDSITITTPETTDSVPLS